MRAVMYLAPGHIGLKQVPKPKPGWGEILVRVRAALTCGTDVKTYRRGHPKFPPPFIFGHEFAGDIVELGRGAAGFSIGQRVTANVFGECGECYYCRQGQGNLCENLVYNFGAFAEYITVPASIVSRNTFVIPDHIPYRNAAVLEPLVPVVHGLNLIRIQPGEIVAIIGAGGSISLMHLQLARLAGAGEIIAVGHSDSRLSTAARLGATKTINAHQENTTEAIRRSSGGRGADVVIECAGTKEAWENSVNSVRKGGRVLWFGGLPGGTKVELDAAFIHYGEISLFGVHGGTAQDARQAFELICSGKLNSDILLTDEYPLEAVETALQSMIRGETVKAVINPLMHAP
ncbi:MAG: hypothetical protein EHM41_06685 [Chloroflexi bacterium]|nr:MAG: hypothetical protein EHM41_06685 [Chloroflexota bacterium]